MPYGASRKGIIMRDTSIVSPGVLSNGFLIRREAAKAISTIEIQAARTAGGKTPAAARLKAFFDDCSSKLVAFVDIVAQTVSTRVRTAANTAVVTFTGPMTPSTSVPLSSIVFTPARTVTAIVVSGSTVTVTATGVIVGDTITYTPPAVIGQTGNPYGSSMGIHDQEGNRIPTFTGVLA